MFSAANMCLYVNCWTFQGYKLPVEQRINIRRIRTLPFFLFLVFKRYIYRLGVKFFLFSLSCFQKTYLQKKEKNYSAFKFCLFHLFSKHIFTKKRRKKKKNLLHIQILPLRRGKTHFLFFVFQRHIYKERQKPLAHSNSAATSRLLREDRMNSRLCRRSFVTCLQIHKGWFF